MNKVTCFFCMLFFICMHAYPALAQSSSSKTFKGPIVYINLMRQSNNSPVLIDGVAAMYSNDFSCNIDSNDALKLYNINQGIFLSRSGKNLSVEARKIPLFKDTLFIQMWELKQVSYSLQIVPQNIQEMMPAKAWLIDKYLNRQKELDFQNPTSYDFKPDINNPDSYVNRFLIVFNRLRQAASIKVQTNNFGNIDSNKHKDNISLYPNPVSGNTINLKFEDVVAGDYNISLSSGIGNIVYKSKLHHAGGNNNYTIITNSNKINTGIYTLVVSGTNNEKAIHLPVIINK